MSWPKNAGAVLKHIGVVLLVFVLVVSAGMILVAFTLAISGLVPIVSVSPEPKRATWASDLAEPVTGPVGEGSPTASLLPEPVMSSEQAAEMVSVVAVMAWNSETERYEAQKFPQIEKWNGGCLPPLAILQRSNLEENSKTEYVVCSWNDVMLSLARKGRLRLPKAVLLFSSKQAPEEPFKTWRIASIMIWDADESRYDTQDLPYPDGLGGEGRPSWPFVVLRVGAENRIVRPWPFIQVSSGEKEDAS